jgi:DNA-binding NarL/FixJ family response regulator
MRVIVADDKPEVRSALKLLLEDKPDIDVVSEVGTSYELLWQVRASCPDLLILDWELPGTKPENLLSVLHSLCPHVSVIALSSTPQMRQAAIASGASEFVCKSEPPENLLAALDKCYLKVNSKNI